MIKTLVNVLIGLSIAAASFYTGWVGLRESPANLRLVEIAAAGILLGGFLIDKDPIFDALKQLLSLLPEIKIGGGPPTP